MHISRAVAGIGLLLLTAGHCAGAAANLSGTWSLNVKKSSWSSVRRPSLVVLDIDHREPALKFNGVVEHPNEETRHFAFEGAIDGRPYPASRSYGPGTVELKRIDDATVRSTFRTPDGQYVEITEIVLSHDGRFLTQRIRLTAPNAKRSWTEVYERRSGP